VIVRRTANGALCAALLVFAPCATVTGDMLLSGWNLTESDFVWKTRTRIRADSPGWRATVALLITPVRTSGVVAADTAASVSAGKVLEMSLITGLVTFATSRLVTCGISAHP